MGGSGNNKRRIIFAVVLMGFSGLVAQIVLLRELMVAFHGNELSIAVVLANWMLLEAAGARFLGGRITAGGRGRGLFILVTVLFSVFFIAAVYGSRVFKEFLNLLPGEGLGIMPMFYVSFIILLPVSLLHGALFTSGCRLYSQYTARPTVGGDAEGHVGGDVDSHAGGEVDGHSGGYVDGHSGGYVGGHGNSRDDGNGAGDGAGSIARVYIWETVGTLVGGLVLTYLLIPFLNSVSIAAVLALMNFIACTMLLKPFWKPGIPQVERVVGVMLYSLVIISVLLLGLGGAERIHDHSVMRQWRGQNLVHYQNSNYGNIVVVESHNEYTFYSDGLPVITTPNPDLVYVEEFVHFPLLSHPAPQDIVVLSGGAGGVIREILKHGVRRVDYAEVDPLLPEVVEKFPTSLTEKELADERVSIKYTDGRFYLKRTDHRYDVILSGFTDPSSLQTNRFFTREFFLLAGSRLAPGGIFVMGLPGSLTYMSPELADMNAMALATLSEVFPHVRVIPGDGLNLYLASELAESVFSEVDGMMARAGERDISFSLITPGYLEYRLHERWEEWFMDNLSEVDGRVNTDFSPLGVFYSLVWWNEKFSPAFNSIFRHSEKINLPLMAVIFLGMVLIFLAFNSRMRQPIKPALSLCIVSTGFAGMLFDLILIFAFQVLFGYIFYWLGLLVTAFMAGVMAGGLWMTARMKKVDNVLPLLIRLELALIVFALLLPFFFLRAGPLLAWPWFDIMLRILFLLLSFLSGMLVGAEFPLANREYLRLAPDIGGTAGMLYSADLWGGWIGGIFGGVLLLPVLGLVQTTLVIVMFKIVALVVLLFAARLKTSYGT